MKKLRILGIASMLILIVIITALAALAFLGVFDSAPSGEETPKAESPENNSFSPTEWQISETEGDITAVLETTLGKIEIQLAENPAAEKFIELQKSGAFDGAYFDMAPKGFIRLFAEGEGYELGQNELGCFHGAVGFIYEGGKAFPQLVIINSAQLSENSAAMLQNGFDSERAALYEKAGGVPEYEGKVIIFGKISSGFEVIEALSSAENSGYAGGYKLIEPVFISGTEILIPQEIPAEGE